MNRFTSVIITFPIVASLAIAGVAAADSSTVSTAGGPGTTATTCSVNALGTKNTAGASNSRFAINSDGTVSATVVVTGSTGCTQTVTFASWEAPDNLKGQPYSQQKLFTSTTQTFGVGNHVITVATPDCFYQLDLIRGSNATAADGSPVYPVGELLGSLHGGTKTCVVTPVTPVTPTTPVTPAQPTVLVNTGTGSNVFIASAVVAILGTAFSYGRRLRQLA